MKAQVQTKGQVIHMTPPASLEAEQSVLGAILLRPAVWEEVAGILQPLDFYREAHRLIYQAMADLKDRGDPIDYVSVMLLLKERGELERVGGGQFLSGLSEHVGIPANADYFARQVHNKALLRHLLICSQEIAGAISNPGANPADVLDFIESQVSEIRGAFKEDGFRATEGAILDIDEFLKTSIPLRKIYLKPWVWEAFIAMISAWRGVGKSAFTMGVINALSRGEPFGPWEITAAVPCLYFDAEMTMQDTLERFQGIYSEMHGREKLWIYSDHLSASLGMPAANLLDEKWRAWLKDEVLLKRGIKLWVLDNIGAVTPGLDENSREAWSPINRWLLDLRFAGISSVLIHHEGKGGEQRGTSAREDNLDISISLKRPKDYHPEDGARFICRFEKARIRQQDLHLIADTEFQMQQDPDGKAVWTYANLKQENKARVLKLFDEGMSAKDIAELVGVSKGRVSQIKSESTKEGLLSEAGKLTQSGFQYVQTG